MAETCSRVSSRPRDFSSHETSCQPSAEDTAARELESQRAAEREAEARRDAYFAASTDEGGRCARAASDASTYSPMTPEDLKLKASLRTKALDRPLQEDVIGNMLVSAAAGGLLSGLGRAAAGATDREVLAHAAKETANDVAKEAAKAALVKSFDTGPDLAGTATRTTTPTTPRTPSPPAPTPPPAATAPSPQPAGHSSPRGTSEPAPEPNMSVAPPLDRFAGPYVIAG